MVQEGLSPNDPSSFSRPELCSVLKIALEWNVDFERHVIFANVELAVERQEDNVETLILDTQDLKIHNITDVDSSSVLSYHLGEPFLTLGTKLVINLPTTDKKTYNIRIDYETSAQASGLQWLKPVQTAGKEHPYLFSHCEPIQARSMLPCQDTPSVKVPYVATVRAPKELVVLMSAVEAAPPVTEGTRKVFSFIQEVPVPSYLIAIVVGALESRELSPRSQVWSEKEMVSQAAHDFAETDAMLSVAESLMGPYVWKRYDILVLPPSFPFGGMENPCLTFVSPTVLTGDRSLSGVIAHEISHSWTGNLVTNRNFEHFWLNEGFTVFTERKIVSHMFGENRRHFEAIGGWKELQYTIGHLGSENPLTCLVPDLRGIDPGDAFSTVPYEKGHSFLFFLEQILGGPGEFEPFMKKYVETFKYKSIITEDWKQFLIKYFKEKVSSQVLDNIDWESWLHKPGMPPVTLQFDTSLTNASYALCERWIKADLSSLSSFSLEDIASFLPSQIQLFLAQLLQEDPLPVQKLEAMEKLYNFHSSKNSEILFRWIRLGLRAKWDSIVDLALKFVVSQGRMKFVRPIYRDLYAWEEKREVAIKNYQDHVQEMMYATAHSVAQDLHLC